MRPLLFMPFFSSMISCSHGLHYGLDLSPCQRKAGTVSICQQGLTNAADCLSGDRSQGSATPTSMWGVLLGFPNQFRKKLRHVFTQLDIEETVLLAICVLFLISNFFIHDGESSLHRGSGTTSWCKPHPPFSAAVPQTRSMKPLMQQ